MVLPLIPLVLIATGGGTAVAGLFQGSSGAAKLQEARQILGGANDVHDRTVSLTEEAVAATNQAVAEHGREQQEAQQRVVTRMADFLRHHQGQVSESPWLLVDGVEAELTQISDFPGALIAASEWLGGAVRAGVTAAATYVCVPAAVSALGTASTGAAIGSLSGAAAQSATLAWLGGGSLASGGGGIALGAANLNLVTVGPAVVVGGLMLNGQGEKALTQSKAYSAEVDVAEANHEVFRTRLRVVNRRVAELSELLGALSTRAGSALDDLERDPFDAESHAERFRRPGVSLSPSETSR